MHILPHIIPLLHRFTLAQRESDLQCAGAEVMIALVHRLAEQEYAALGLNYRHAVAESFPEIVADKEKKDTVRGWILNHIIQAKFSSLLLLGEAKPDAYQQPLEAHVRALIKAEEGIREKLFPGMQETDQLLCGVLDKIEGIADGVWRGDLLGPTSQLEVMFPKLRNHLAAVKHVLQVVKNEKKILPNNGSSQDHLLYALLPDELTEDTIETNEALFSLLQKMAPHMRQQLDRDIKDEKTHPWAEAALVYYLLDRLLEEAQLNTGEASRLLTDGKSV